MTDHRSEGTVDPPEHNLRRTGGQTSKREAKLEDPDVLEQPKSGREIRREEEREERKAGEQSAAGE